LAEAALPSSHSPFCEEVFSCTAHAGTNEVDRTNILAPGLTLLPAFTASECFRRTIGPWEVVSSYSSATAPDSHRISRARSTNQTRKELRAEIAGGKGIEQEEFVIPSGAEGGVEGSRGVV